MIYDESFFTDKIVDDYLQINLNQSLLQIIKSKEFEMKNGNKAVLVVFKVVNNDVGQEGRIFEKTFTLTDKAKYFFRTLAMTCGFSEYKEDGELHLKAFEAKELIGKYLIADVLLDGSYYNIYNLKMPQFSVD